MADYHAILEVPQDATEEQIKAAFRRKARLLHPDSLAAAADSVARQRAAETFHEVTSAYRVLIARGRKQPVRSTLHPQGDPAVHWSSAPMDAESVLRAFDAHCHAVIPEGPRVQSFGDRPIWLEGNAIGNGEESITLSKPNRIYIYIDYARTKMLRQQVCGYYLVAVEPDGWSTLKLHTVAADRIWYPDATACFYLAHWQPVANIARHMLRVLLAGREPIYLSRRESGRVSTAPLFRLSMAGLHCKLVKAAGQEWESRGRMPLEWAELEEGELDGFVPWGDVWCSYRGHRFLCMAQSQPIHGPALHDNNALPLMLLVRFLSQYAKSATGERSMSQAS